MAKKSKHSQDDYIIEFEGDILSEGEDLLAEKNKDVLLAFGSGIAEPAVQIAPKKAVSKSPLETLKANMLSNVKREGSEPATYEEPKNDNPANIEEVKDAKPAEIEKPEPQSEPSLLEKLKRYTIDESGHDVTEDESPLYKLESVAQIIKSNSNSLIGKLSEKYDVTVDTLGKPSKEDFLLKGFENEKQEADTTETESQSEELKEDTPTPTPTFKKMANDSKKRFEKSIFDELFPKEEKEIPEKKNETVPDISDIDSSDISSETAEESKPLSDTATIRFTPIIDKKGNTGRINISSATKAIDISRELTNAQDISSVEPDTSLEVTDFDLFLPKNEITDVAALKAQARKLAYKRRNKFLSATLCLLCVLILFAFFIPFLADMVISSTKGVMTFCSTLLFITVLANADMFKDIGNLFKHRAGHDSLVSLCAIFSLPLCVLAILNGENIYHVILLVSLLMLTRSFTSLMETSTLFLNLRAIKGSNEKNAVTFIKDNSTAVAMAKDSIDGDVLITVPRKTQFVSDFMKFSLFKKKLSGKIPVIFIVTLILAALGAVMSYFYYKNVFSAVYAAAAATMFAAMPAVCFIDALPLFTAAKKLNKKGAMIAGTYGADIIELANAAVVKTSDIFPTGTVVLKSFKVLSNNDIDKTIVNAAALTEEIGSPLAPIFGKIAGTNTSYKKPDSDTIKYEERLGVSGWVDNELLFVGNRTLLQAHGIDVPSIELDRKILKSGYFPVYVATANAACAVIAIQYVVRSDIQKLLRKISKLGITLLVDNCDPNVNEDMICDYFGLYDDSVKVMTNVGVYMYKNATASTNMLSAPASFKGSALSLLRIMSCASGIRVSNKILSIYYILAAILGVWYFAFTSFAVSGGLLPGSAMLLFEFLATLLSFIAFLIKKP